MAALEDALRVGDITMKDALCDALTGEPSNTVSEIGRPLTSVINCRDGTNACTGRRHRKFRERCSDGLATVH